MREKRKGEQRERKDGEKEVNIVNWLNNVNEEKEEICEERKDNGVKEKEGKEEIALDMVQMRDGKEEKEVNIVNWLNNVNEEKKRRKRRKRRNRREKDRVQT